MAEQMRIAFYGDSYIRRMEDYVGGDMKVPGDVAFFGMGGMRAEGYNTKLMEKLEKYRPHYAFVHLGGNDIRFNSSPKEIVQWTREVIQRIQDCGVRKVFFLAIMERGTFRDKRLTKKCFNAQRRKINDKVAKLNGVGLINMKVNFPRDYLKDKVHLSERGYFKLTMKLRHVMSSLSLKQ